MVITAENIARAVSDMPVQPLFNTLGEVCRRAGIGIVVTNTETNLQVTCTSVIGSAQAGTTLTDEMFASAISNLSVSGFSITDNVYFSFLKLDNVLSIVPLEFRTDAAGLSPAATVQILKSIGIGISDKIKTDIFTNLQSLIVDAGVPNANLQFGQAGKIQWNPLAALGEGQSFIYTFLDTIISLLPLPMLPGGSAGDLVVAWVNQNNFATLKNAVTQSYQHTANGGFTTNYFQYVKEADTIAESRNKIFAEFIRYKNIIIMPLNGLTADSIICTYQEGIAADAPVFVSTIPESDKNNFYFAVKGDFKDYTDFLVPIDDASQAISDLPYQVSNSIAVNKAENTQASFKIISNLGYGIVLREVNKIFAVFPAANA